MSQITRTWLAFTAIGAGLIHLALVISSPLPIGLVLAALGISEFGWGLLTLLRDSPVAPRVVIAVALVPFITWALAVVAAVALSVPALATTVPVMPLAAASGFEIFVAVALTRYLRRGVRVGSPPSAVRYLGAVLAGALVVGFVTTPALAATTAGQFAHPHGEHSLDGFNLHSGH
jgi:hypothetical protein